MTEDYWPLELDSTEEDIETSFAPITVLHLRGIFPWWSSTAYHGLVDLRLLSTNAWSHIQEVQLLAILKSSPGLRVLHFGLEIHDLTAATERVVPVILQDLQIVKIFPDIDIVTYTTMCPGSLLRLLAPGTKPLQLSLEGFYIQDTTSLTELERFFARSRVARFYTRAMFPPLNLLLRHSAHLEQVVLDDFASASHNKLPPAELDVDESASLPRLSSLHITSSALFDHELRLLLRCCPDGTVLDSSNVDHDISEDYPLTTTFSTPELLEAFPTIKIADSSFGLRDASNADWDIFD
ncbi:F-box-like domain protein [Rhizoctonia solani AG-3 Rhs1AP]|nr:F-box-like domain protein [Rhizoctonia solani AG-3 Rhs1AP]